MSRILGIEEKIGADGEAHELGQAHPDTRTVVIDPRQCSRDFLGTLVHESIHLMVADVHCAGCGEHQGDWPEEKVEEWERLISDAVWAAGYRRVQP